MAMYYRTFNHSEGDRHREFEERWEKEWQEKLSQRLGMRNKEQHDLIEDLQEKIKKTDAYNDWIHWALEWKQQYDRYIGCLKIDIAKAHSYSNNQLKEAEETKIRRYKQILDTFHFLQSLYSDNITLLKKESKFRNDDFFRQYYSKVGRDADMTLTAYRNTEASQKITRLYIDNISRAQDILQLIKRASSEFYITNAGQKGEDAVEYVLKWLRPYGYMPVEKTCLTKYGTISILLQNKSFINEAQEYDHTQIKEHGGEHREWMAQFREHLNITELERSIVVALIDRILIYKDNRVEVRFRFADEFAWQTDILRRSQIREVV